MLALDALSSAVPPEMVSAVASRDSTKEAREAIRVMRVSDDRVRASTTQQLLRQLENAMFEEESIEDFSMRLSGMVQHLATQRGHGGGQGGQQISPECASSVPVDHGGDSNAA
jgi:hypothetical protein